MIYLASASPQRAFLLARANFRYQVVRAPHDESGILHDIPQAMALERARHKAEAVQLDMLPGPLAPHDVVVAADTVTSLGSAVFGKPLDDDDAVRILMALQGTTHIVTTAHVCYIPPHDGREAVMAQGVSFAQVTMRPVAREEIVAYVRSGESYERSGAYAIQESGDEFVTDRQGPIDTVIGLHIETVRRLHRECTGADPERDEA